MAAGARRALEHEIERIGARLPAASPGPAVPTGLGPLDDLLPHGGLPRGRIVEWTGPPSCGKTAVLRASLERLRRDGESVALIDGTHGLYAPDWLELVPGEGEFWIVRPDSAAEAAWCADLLLRSGAFGAVALRVDEPARGAAAGSRTPEVLGRAASVRLQRLAEESASVFVAVGRVAVAALRLGFRPARIEPLAGAFGPLLPSVRPVWVRVGKRGEAEVPVLCPAPPHRADIFSRDRKGPL